MPLDTTTVVEEVNSITSVTDKDGNTGNHPATDERLELVRALLDKLDDALASEGADEIRATSADGNPSESTTTAGNNVSVTHADGPVQVAASVSGTATLTVEVSHDGGSTWTELTYSLSGSGDEGAPVIHGFADVRASVNQNLNRLTIAAKGVGG